MSKPRFDMQDFLCARFGDGALFTSAEARAAVQAERERQGMHPASSNSATVTLLRMERGGFVRRAEETKGFRQCLTWQMVGGSKRPLGRRPSPRWTRILARWDALPESERRAWFEQAHKEEEGLRRADFLRSWDYYAKKGRVPPAREIAQRAPSSNLSREQAEQIPTPTQGTVRERALWLLAQGVRQNQIAQRLGVSRERVSQIVKRERRKAAALLTPKRHPRAELHAAILAAYADGRAFNAVDAHAALNQGRAKPLPMHRVRAALADLHAEGRIYRTGRNYSNLWRVGQGEQAPDDAHEPQAHKAQMGARQLLPQIYADGRSFGSRDAHKAVNDLREAANLPPITHRSTKCALRDLYERGLLGFDRRGVAKLWRVKTEAEPQAPPTARPRTIQAPPAPANITRRQQGKPAVLEALRGREPVTLQQLLALINDARAAQGKQPLYIKTIRNALYALHAAGIVACVGVAPRKRGAHPLLWTLAPDEQPVNALDEPPVNALDEPPVNDANNNTNNNADEPSP